MSNIDAQIKALQLKKKKIDYVAYITDLVKNDTKCIDFKDVKDEVVKKITPFLKELIEAIEKDAEVKQPEQMFTLKQILILKTVADSIANKPLTNKAEEPKVVPLNKDTFSKEDAPAPVKKPQQSELSTNDKMNFAMNHRHLSQKRVEVINDTGTKIFGSVVGLDAPHVLVKTDTGPTIQVPIEKVVPQ